MGAAASERRLQMKVKILILLAILAMLPLSTLACGGGGKQLAALEVAFPKLSLQNLVHLTYAPDGSNRLFAVLQNGQIMVFPNDPDVASAKVFLDIAHRVNYADTEEGFLGLAFDPGYGVNGYFYVSYTTPPPRRSIISRFSVRQGDPDQADPTSELVIIEVAQPFPNHNGGHIVFGPDSYLYIGLGDGGSAGDPQNNGQNRSTMLGSILRIDVSGAIPGAPYAVPLDNPFVGTGINTREEIWAYGLRNPWQFNFDPVTGDLWAADVGQDDYEEIDIVKRGANSGWNIMEGAHCYPPSVDVCNQSGLEVPIFEYTHAEGCSVIGGYVYRGSRLPWLQGAYLYGDYCSGKIWALHHDGIEGIEHMQVADSEFSISAFGEDAQREDARIRDRSVSEFRNLRDELIESAERRLTKKETCRQMNNNGFCLLYYFSHDEVEKSEYLKPMGYSELEGKKVYHIKVKEHPLVCSACPDYAPKSLPGRI